MRENGSNIIFSECTDVFDNTCLTTDDPPANVNHFHHHLHSRCCCHHYYPFYTKETWDCKDIDNYQCSSLDQLFEVDVNLVITVLKDVMVTVIRCFDSSSNNDSDTFDGNPQCNNGYCHNLTSVYRCHINETNIMNQVILAITIIIIIIIIIDILHGHCYQ